jgi:phosphatidylglycerophosphate synthase
METEITRRPIAARDTKWAARIAAWLARNGVRPNQVSVFSVVCGGMAGAAFVVAGHGYSPVLRSAWIAAAVAIQLRLLCNLFDGMIAIESGLRTKSGEIYNELPDRFSDTLILAGAGYSFPWFAWLPALGWSASVLAVITAYVRALGAATGTQQYFLGPMAKQHRMAIMTLAALASAVGEFLAFAGYAITAALGLVVLGCLVTIARRCRRIVSELESK